MKPLRLLELALILALLAPLVGCGPSRSSTTEGVVAPHRGALLKLPDNLGYAEVVAEASGGTPKAPQAELAAYFLAIDAKTPMTTTPTAVSLEVILAEAKTRQSVPLKPSPKPDTPSGTGRFAATPPPGFDGVITGGKLSANIGGRDVVISF